jgi:hypothetical protein
MDPNEHWKSANIRRSFNSVFQPHPPENPPEEKEALTIQLETPYQLELPGSTSSIDQKFKPSSTTSNLKVPQATISSWAKFFRNYLPLASNISNRYSTLPCSQDTSLHNGK